MFCNRKAVVFDSIPGMQSVLTFAIVSGSCVAAVDVTARACGVRLALAFFAPLARRVPVVEPSLVWFGVLRTIATKINKTYHMP